MSPLPALPSSGWTHSWLVLKGEIDEPLSVPPVELGVEPLFVFVAQRERQAKFVRQGGPFVGPGGPPYSTTTSASRAVCVMRHQRLASHCSVQQRPAGLLPTS